MKDERVQNILEKKHPYENFNKEVGSMGAFVSNFSTLEENVIPSFQLLWKQT